MSEISNVSGYGIDPYASLGDVPSAVSNPYQQGDSSMFSSMLTQMMGFGSTGGSDSSSMMLGMMLPVLMNLVEKLIALEAGQFDPGMQSMPYNAGGKSSLPVSGPITQEFHDQHHGLDISVVTGTPVQTSIGGKVVYAGWNDQGYGNLVIVENGPYKTYYAHLSEVNVEVGQTVNQHSVVGLSGSTGNSTGPHLHYEIRIDGVQVDPLAYHLEGKIIEE